MKSILVPTDFSNTASFAHEYAKAIARKTGHEIMAIHAYLLPALDATIPSEIRDAIRQEETKNADKLFKEFFHHRPNQLASEDIAVRVKESYRVLEGSAANVIIEESESEDVDLIVMGTKGAHSVAEKIFGSVTSTVVQSAKKPVLVVPEGATFKEIKNIAYATNYEKGDENFIDFLEKFSADFDANTHFVHINDSGKSLESSLLSKTKSENHLHFDMGFVSFTEMADKSVLEGLNKFVEEENIDIIALFIPNRGLWDRLFHVSLTKKMVFSSKVPLLIFHG